LDELWNTGLLLERKNQFLQSASRQEMPRGGSWEREAARAAGFCWSFQADFTNEMSEKHPADQVGSNGHPVLCFLNLPSMASFPYVFDHFISEMAACTQQQNPAALAASLSQPPPLRHFLARCALQNLISSAVGWGLVKVLTVRAIRVILFL